MNAALIRHNIIALVCKTSATRIYYGYCKHPSYIRIGGAYTSSYTVHRGSTH